MTDSSFNRNKDPILEVLKKYISSDTRLLEIGSGSGQHAEYFCEYFKKLHWVTSDTKQNIEAIKERLKNAKLKNVHGPELLEIGVHDFPKGLFDYVFSANTLHIMPWKVGKTLFKLLGKRLREGSLVFFYGPFNYQSKFTSQSNEDFDKLLKEKDPKCGIRNFEDIVQIMIKCEFKLLIDHEMPANNHMLIFERLPFKGKIERSKG